MAAVLDETLRREFYAAALSGLLASGKILEVDILTDDAGQPKGHRMEHGPLVAQMAGVMAVLAVAAFKAPKPPAPKV
ncbi:hypothetical protein [Cypionkella sp. TWP1-2-1b2]|uniref:hypothetical protein n=1 Tax=Cypionkella sp. TWP1-2-1b2 TaxID=2804675 RepID=UPI003CFB1FF8